MSKELDFTKQYWGHAISCIHELKPKGRLDKVKNKIRPTRKWSALLISSREPKEGDTLKLKSDQGIMVAKILSSDWKRDPKDMYGITFEYKYTEKTK